ESRRLLLSFFVWLIGLCVAVWGGKIAYEAQKGFVSARRNRRHATGARVMGGNRYARLLGVIIEDEPETLYDRANAAQHAAQNRWNRARNIGVASMILFLIGAVFALATLLASGITAKKSEPASRSSTITCYFCR